MARRGLGPACAPFWRAGREFALFLCLILRPPVSAFRRPRGTVVVLPPGLAGRRGETRQAGRNNRRAPMASRARVSPGATPRSICTGGKRVRRPIRFRMSGCTSNTGGSFPRCPVRFQPSFVQGACHSSLKVVGRPSVMRASGAFHPGPTASAFFGSIFYPDLAEGPPRSGRSLLAGPSRCHRSIDGCFGIRARHATAIATIVFFEAMRRISALP